MGDHSLQVSNNWSHYPTSCEWFWVKFLNINVTFIMHLKEMSEKFDRNVKVCLLLPTASIARGNRKAIILSSGWDWCYKTKRAFNIEWTFIYSYFRLSKLRRLRIVFVGLEAVTGDFPREFSYKVGIDTEKFGLEIWIDIRETSQLFDI